ncbi:tail fiber protein [Cladorrhinum sp. PSN259]|nr:tail fiber protein [Cladorrhinum sp. PSN259]
MSSNTDAKVAVGSVVMFAGDLTNIEIKTDLTASGWLPCDGSSYTQGSYPELFSAIGFAHGGSGETFNVPDLTDRFVRGTNGDANNDPDQDSRTAAAPGGATANNVGSVQTTATALPKNAWVLQPDGNHTHAFQHLTTTMNEVWTGTTDTMARFNETVTVSAAGGHFHTLSGGDAASVPINMALYWVIRAKPATASGTTPAAALSALGASASSISPTGWIYCNGAAQPLTKGNTAFITAIGSNFGGDGKTVFNVPDLRGQFIRGTDHSTGRDPDVAKRFSIMGGGSTGDNVGSAQTAATGNGSNPMTVQEAGNHRHSVAGVPADDHHSAYGASGFAAFYTMEWTNGSMSTTESGTHTHSVTGGDKETRPANAYLDWIVANADIADAPPVGTVMAYAGDVSVFTNSMTLGNLGWISCTGIKLPKSDPTYQALFNVIGTTFGGDKLNFCVPDLRGRFVVGAGGKLGGAVGQVQKTSLTGPPQVAFATSPVGDHTHQLYGPPSQTHVIDVVLGWDLAAANSSLTASSEAGLHTHAIQSGGDAETRPLNVYVDYIIRAR